MFDPVGNKVLISRDVVFEEKKTWCWNLENEETRDSGNTFTMVQTREVYEQESDTSQSTDEGSASGGCSNSGPQSPISGASAQASESGSSSVSSEPKQFRNLVDIYNATEEVELDDELLLMGVDEPRNYTQAVKDCNWRKAMQREMESIEQNNTWKLTVLPAGRKVIGLKWIYKIKRDENGEIVKYKARLVAKGYVQEQGVDFDEIFAPVTRIETVRLLLALAARYGWQVHHLDVKTAFLNGEILEEVYVSQPEGFIVKGKENSVYKLLKALYGLRQAPRAWYAKLNKSLENMGFIRCPHEHAVYVRRGSKDVFLIGVYVDDLLVTGNSVETIEKFKQEMNEQFEMNNLGKLSYYLGIEVKQGSDYVELKQTGYAKKILEKAGMSGCNPTKYPMDPKEHLTKDEGGELVDPTEYKSLVGGLRYLVHTRPDIAYSVGIVSRFMEKPSVVHKNAVKRILRYVSGTLQFG